MELYVCQVSTGEEQKYIRLFSARNRDLLERLQFHVPQRQLKIRRGGKVRTEKQTLFPGYVFVETQNMEPELTQVLRRTNGFYRILPETINPRPLPPEQRGQMSRLINGGHSLGLSKASFNENGRIQILSGPLEGLEGSIVKVDRRKQRVRVRLDLYEDSHLIDLGYEEVTSSNSPENTASERA